MKKKALRKARNILLTLCLIFSILLNSMGSIFTNIKAAQPLNVTSSIDGNEIFYTVNINKEEAVNQSGQSEEDLFLLNQFSDNEEIIDDINLNGISW